MANEEIMIGRVYLRQVHLWKSAHHRAMAPAPHQPNAQPGADQAIVVLQFLNGVAAMEDSRGVLRPCAIPKNIYDIFADLGIATTTRPLSQAEQYEASLDAQR